MSTYILTATRRAAYAALFDFRTQLVKAARQILADGGITAIGPGEGDPKLARAFTSVDFQIGAATGKKSPVFLGDYRYSEYSEFIGTLSIMNCCGYETDEKSITAYLTEDHVRQLDTLTSTEHALFMEHLEPFTAAYLPNLDVLQILPIEPDERQESEREVNVAYFRRRIRFQIRSSAWPQVA